MFSVKTPVSQSIEKNEMTAYNPHSISLDKRVWPEVVKVISIDPGIRNLALRVESRGIRNNQPIKTLIFDKLHIKEEDRKLIGNIDQLYLLITNFLDQYLHVFKECHIMLIERQIPKNYKAVRISQHILSYMMIHLKDLKQLPMIFEVDSKLKGRELGASKHLNERGIKQWSIDHCKELLTVRQDFAGLEILRKNKKKADDLSDTCVMAEAVFSFHGWPLTCDLSKIENQNKTVLKIIKPLGKKLSEETILKKTSIPLSKVSPKKNKKASVPLPPLPPNNLSTSLPINQPKKSPSSLPAIQKLPPLPPNPLSQSSKSMGTISTIQPTQKLKLKIVSN